MAGNKPNLENNKLEELLRAYKENSTPDNLQALLDLLRDSTVLVPGKIDADKTISASILKAGEDRAFLPVYTSTAQITDQVPPMESVLAIPYVAANELATRLKTPAQPLDGIAINPFTENIRFTFKLIEAIQNAEIERKRSGEKKPVDLGVKPVQLPPIDNKEVEEKMASFHKETDTAKRTALVNGIFDGLFKKNVVLCMRKNDKGVDMPVALINNETKKQYLVVYTNVKAALDSKQSTNISVVPFERAVNLALVDLKGIDGIVISGPGVILTIEQEGLRQINTTYNKKLEAEKNAEAMQDESWQLICAHQQFELNYLPKKIFEEGEPVIDELLERREEYVDELFEASYYDIRMYPYLTNEFQVTAITSEGDLDVIHVVFPARDQGIGCAECAYIVWNRAKKTARYFAITHGMEKTFCLVEQTATETIPMGNAPSDGTRFSAIIDIVNGK